MSKSVSTQTALRWIQRLQGEVIEQANRTYAYFLVLQTNHWLLTVESAWTLYKNNQVYLNIKQEPYGQIASKVGELVGQPIGTLLVDERTHHSRLTLSTSYALDIFPAPSSLLWALQASGQSQCLEYHADGRFFLGR